MPPPGTVRGATQYPLASEPGLLQRPLLTDISDLSGGFHPVDLRMGEQVSHQQPLRRRTVTTSPELGRQRDSDGPAVRDLSGLDLAPGNSAYSIGAADHHQRPAA